MVEGELRQRIPPNDFQELQTLAERLQVWRWILPRGQRIPGDPCYAALGVPRTHGAGRRAGGFEQVFLVGDLRRRIHCRGWERLA